MGPLKQAGLENAEILLVIHDKALAEKDIKNWQDHVGHSEPYMGRQDLSFLLKEEFDMTCQKV
jgi:hypothetical protein